MAVNNELPRVAVVATCNLSRVGVESSLDNKKFQCLAMPEFTAMSAVKSFLLVNVPDVMVITVQLYHSDINGIIDLVRTVKWFNPLVRVMIMLDINIECVSQRLMALGVQGIINLDVSMAEWQDFFRRMSSGDINYFGYARNMESNLKPNWCQSALLSKNENRLLGYLLAGNSLTASAMLMSRTKKSVANQKASAMRKLGLTHVSQLIAVRGMLNV